MEETQKIAIGYHWGHLTVVEDAGLKGRIQLWLCQCDCGNTITLSEPVVKRGYQISCGCVPPNRPHKDYTGTVVGQLTVLGPTGKRDAKGYALWHCRCSCGTELDVAANRISGKSKVSCGCKAYPPCTIEAGQVYGRLTVIEKTEKKRGTDSLWLCQCECGNKTLMIPTNLTDGSCVSCGCYRKEASRKGRGVIDGTMVCTLKMNRKTVATNKSGYNGVSKHKDGKWVAQIGFKGKKIYLGVYADIQDAVKARKAAEERLFGTFLEWYHGTYPDNPSPMSSEEEIPVKEG